MPNLILITGGTGWVGRNFIHELQKSINPQDFNEIVKVFGSKEGELKSTFYSIENQIKIPVYNLKDISKLFSHTSNINLIHSAFLRREKIEKFGLNKYIEINNSISSLVCQFLKNSYNSKTIIISSGAATLLENGNREIKDDPYGYLKLNEEKMLSEVSNSKIFRIYGLTGKFMRDPNLFAFGDFLLSAISNQQIEVFSKQEIIRSYGFATDIAKLGIRWLLSDAIIKNKLIHTASETLSINDLAKIISEKFKLGSIKSNISDYKNINIYKCEINTFRNTLINNQIQPTSLDEQIQETYDYLRINLKE